MAGAINHRFDSPVADAGVSTEVGPNEWDDSHILSGGNDSDAMVRRTSAPDGWELIKLGASPLWVQNADVNNSGTGETDLHTYTIPAAHFNVNNRAIRITAWGIFTANANTKTIRLRFGAGTAIVANAVTAAPNGSRWRLTAVIVRTSSNNQEVFFESMVALLHEQQFRQAQTETDANAITLKVTGQSGTGSNDMKIEGSMVEFLG
jgi:hypothetical protein